MEQSTAVGERLLAGIRARDAGAIAACFAPQATFDVLTPHQLRRHHGREEIAARYEYWLGPLEPFRVLGDDTEQIADRVRVRYRFHGRDGQKGWQVNEHTVYAAVEDGAIVAATATCTGFRPSGARA